jgi:hypothetical protein
MPTTPNRGWVYPTESQNPYYETIEDFFLAQDADVLAKQMVDAKGDLLVASAADTVARLAVGTDEQILVADSTQATGMKWAAPPASSVLTGTWVYSTNTTIADPGSGAFRVNTATIQAATTLALDRLTDGNTDATPLIMSMVVGDILYVQEKIDATNWARYQLTAAPINQGPGNWFQLAVSVIASGGGAISGNSKCVFTTSLSSAGANIPVSLLDAKGDLIAGTAADTAGRLAVGTNGQVLTAASGQATGLQWATPSWLPVAGGSMTGPIGLYSAGADPSTAGDLQRNGNAARYHYGQAVASLGLVLWTLPQVLGTGADTTEDTLGTYTLPANTLTVAGRELHGRFHYVSGSGTPTVRFYVGTTAVYTRTASSPEESRLEVIIRRDVANTQDCSVFAINTFGQALTRVYISGQAETASIVLKSTGQSSTGTAFNIAQTAGSIVMLG